MKKVYKTTKSRVQNASQQMYLNDIPGFISVEAPSSRLYFPGIYASTSYMSNQTHAYEK